MPDVASAAKSLGATHSSVVGWPESEIAKIQRFFGPSARHFRNRERVPDGAEPNRSVAVGVGGRTENVDHE